jgi:hypothetical protein
MGGSKKRAGWPWITVAVLMLPVLYVASFGPACWLMADTFDKPGTLPLIYLPLVKVVMRRGFFGDAMLAYARFAMRPDTLVCMPSVVYWPISQE